MLLIYFLVDFLEILSAKHDSMNIRSLRSKSFKNCLENYPKNIIERFFKRF